MLRAHQIQRFSGRYLASVFLFALLLSLFHDLSTSIAIVSRIKAYLTHPYCPLRQRIGLHALSVLSNLSLSFHMASQSIHKLTSEIQSLEDAIVGHIEKLKEFRDLLSPHSRHNSHNTPSSNVLETRRRAIDKYILQSPGGSFPASSDAITLGNQRTCYLDVFNDARVFVQDGRTDTDVFLSLYGIMPSRVLEIFGK